MTEWQPNETAPRRTRILLGWWHSGSSGLFHDLHWRQGPGEARYSLFYRRVTGRKFGRGYATHWMPLPEPPTTET